MNELRIKRIYAPAGADDGYRILTDRLWSRGITKERAALDEWDKEIPPTVSLRKWFGHKPEHFQRFKEAYIKELNESPHAADFARKCRQRLHDSSVTLLYGARDEACNHAIVLRDWIMGREV